MKSFEQLKKLYEYEEVGSEGMEEINENEYVSSVINNGSSGQKVGVTGYTAYSVSGDEFDFYY